MNFGKVILVAWVTFAFLIMTGLIFGLSQMGDCFPEPAELRACLNTQRTAGNVVLMVAAAVYVSAVVLIICRGKKR